MGGAVSSGRDNTELIDNLMGGNYIRSRDVERVFRALDRGDYMTPEARDQAYKDLAWRNGPLHMSAPCIYSEVMEGLELKPGLSFLNVGSGTGYLSTLVGLILGSSGINHGVEVHPSVVEYATKKLTQFLDVSPTLDEFDFCEPKFTCGNGLCLAPLQTPYDRVYCGAGCPEEYQNYFQQLIKVGGILIMPLNDNLLQVRRTGHNEWVTRSLLNVSFATLRVPSKEEKGDPIRLEEQSPVRLQVLARAVIRSSMRGAMQRRHPQVREPPPRAPPAKRACPRRICIPVHDDSDSDGLNALHDLDRGSGANEMNALLSLVLSMGHNRVAGALRVDPLDSDSSSSSYSPEVEQPRDEDRMSPTLRIVNVNERPPSGDEANPNARPSVRSVLMFEFRDRNGVVRHTNPPLHMSRRDRRRARRHRQRRRHSHDPHHPHHERPDDPPANSVSLRTAELRDHDGNVLETNADVFSFRTQATDEADERRRAHREALRAAEAEAERAQAEQAAEEQVAQENNDDEVEYNIDDAYRFNDSPGIGLFDNQFDAMEEHIMALKEEEASLNRRLAALREDRDSEDEEAALENNKTALENNEGCLGDRDIDLGNEKFIFDANVTHDEVLISENNKKSSEETEIKPDDGSSTSHQHASPSKCHRERSTAKKGSRHRSSCSRDKDKKTKKSRHRSSKPTRRAPRDENGESHKNPEVPAEVEICLGKTQEMAGPSTMEWESTDAAETEAKAASSEEETVETAKEEEKRQKLDSGIGEENSPSGASGSHHSGEDSDDSQGSSSDTDSDEGCDEDGKGRRRRGKRGHLSTRSSSSTEEGSGSEELVRSADGSYVARRPRRPRPRRDPASARRAALSLLMKRAIKELPLPHSLQKFVNLGRCFEF